MRREQVEGREQYRRRHTDAEPNRGWRWVMSVAALVACLDWTTKMLVVANIPVGYMWVVWEDRLALWHVSNHALILGLLGGLPLTFRKLAAVLLGAAATVLLTRVVVRSHRLLPHRRLWAWLFAGLVLGGMLGNLGERALHWGVTDFLSFRWGRLWLPPGNVADLAIALSIPLALVIIGFELEARSRRRSLASEDGPGVEPEPADQSAAVVP